MREKITEQWDKTGDSVNYLWGIHLKQPLLDFQIVFHYHLIHRCYLHFRKQFHVNWKRKRHFKPFEIQVYSVSNPNCFFQCPLTSCMCFNVWAGACLLVCAQTKVEASRLPHRDQRAHIAVKLHSKHITLSSSYPHSCSRSLSLYLISPNPVKQDRQG